MWANWYWPAARAALEHIFFSKIPAGTSILDLCCGSGHVTRELINRGFRVVGIDSSAMLIELARRDNPRGDFRAQDARCLQLDRRFGAVLSTFDSLNHILTREDLERVFAEVFRILLPGGLFVFDMNLEEAYGMDLRQWIVDISDTEVGMIRGTFDPGTKLATTELIWFIRRDEKSDLWKRHHATVRQRCYPEAEIVNGMRAAGFGEIEIMPATRAGVNVDLGYGRIFVSARA
jgi:SAM-dependent methyltransferase